MQTSGDYFLINLLAVIAPAVIILLSTYLVGYNILIRYSKAISRLYKMNFSNLEYERQKIANDLHDEFGYKIIVLNRAIEDLESNLNIQNDKNINIIKSQINLFTYDIRRTLETIHPRNLSIENWRKSLSNLIDGINIGNLNVQIYYYTETNPIEEHLLHVYRIIQEKITNIIRHTNSSRIQINIIEENNNLIISIIYNTSRTPIINKIKQNKNKFMGRGINIINDRLKIINGTNTLTYSKKYIIDTIKIPL